MASAIPEEEVVETSSGKWLRFNDILVDEFTMNDIAVEIECFGGYYSTKGSDSEWTLSLHGDGLRLYHGCSCLTNQIAK